MTLLLLLLQPLTLILFLGLTATGANSEGTRFFTLVNICNETVWPGITHGESFNGSGSPLKPGQAVVYTAPSGWSGRIWGRTGCIFDKKGNGSCLTGSCGTSLNCTVSGTPPMSIAEFTLGDIDYYDVSLVDGFNIPIVVTPLRGNHHCSDAGCDGDLRLNCPSELTVKSDGKIIACRSACNYFNNDEYCCRGAFGSAETCKPSNYSKTFKAVCPVAYSYAFDAATSVKTCTGAEYVVSFCSSRNGTVCTYHDTNLTCTGYSSSGAIDVHQRWWQPMMLCIAFIFMFIPSSGSVNQF